MESAKMVLVSGKRSYDAREALKDAGGRWSPVDEAWIMTAEQWESVRTGYYGANKRGRDLAAAIATLSAREEES